MTSHFWPKMSSDLQMQTSNARSRLNFTMIGRGCQSQDKRTKENSITGSRNAAWDLRFKLHSMRRRSREYLFSRKPDQTGTPCRSEQVHVLPPAAKPPSRIYRCNKYTGSLPFPLYLLTGLPCLVTPVAWVAQILTNNSTTPALLRETNLMRSLTVRLEVSYCSITVSNHRLITVIRFVSKSYTRLWKSFANYWFLTKH